ncbi:MAG TPA: O-methyltransferase [Candidatus Limnocylindrales bacterium]|jgi:predicted O-methyltransferase YrrM|nr:O-methyltransferase [Candidatus Limnocylindrales bacterium]
MKVIPEQWVNVDQYVNDVVVHSDAALAAALQASTSAGLPAISVTPSQGKLLQLLAQIHHAQSMLEIGTLGGYSTIWLARALPPSGRLITLELNPQYAEVARVNIARANLAHAVEFQVGAALELLPRLAHHERAPFDLIFIDADKVSTPDYFSRALKLSRPGSVIITDNVVRDGALADSTSTDPSVQGMRRFTEMLGKEPRVSATVIQTVGSKGYDGFAVALVK